MSEAQPQGGHGRSLSEVSPAELQQRFVAFVRAFGLHRPDETPCGAHVSVSEAHALTVLADQGGISQSELARHLELTKSTVSRLVGLLEQRGWVVRRSADDDARRRIVELTPKGRQLATEIAERRQDRLARLLDHIPEHDRGAVLDALDTLAEAARELPDP
jgi:DNA-binding MarR family transcriptional regulator